MTLPVYLLSIVDSGREIMMAFFTFAMVGVIVSVFALAINDFEPFVGHYEEERNPSARTRAERIGLERRNLFLKMQKLSLRVAVLFGTLLVLIPNSQSVLKAYVMVEGSQIANADNVEKVAKMLGEKLGLKP